VRNLALRDGEKGLSTGEKQMYVKAKKILASELMYAKTMSEEDALAWLEETLTNGAKPKAPRKATTTAAAKTPAAPKAAAKAPAKKAPAAVAAAAKKPAATAAKKKPATAAR
jgi:hypothetical protein